MAEEKVTSVESTVREIRRKTRKKYNAEEKMRIVLEGLRGETSIAELCRREGLHPNQYYKWSKEFLEAGKQRLVGDIHREADSREVNEMRSEIEQLKQLVAELALKNRVLKKACWARTRHGRIDHANLEYQHAAQSGRETGDHPPGGTLAIASQENFGRVERPCQHLLSLVSKV